MTISSSVRKAGPFPGNGSTTVFAFSFKVFTTADVLVVLADTTTGTETTQAIGTNYTVSLNGDQNASPGGTITMLVAPATGTTLTLTSQVSQTQSVDLQNAGGFYPAVINTALDKIVILIQQLQVYLSGALKLPLSAVGVSATLPAPVPGQLLGWDATGTAIINQTPQSSALAVQQTSALGSAILPKGTTAQRDPVPQPGFFRWNTTLVKGEIYNGTSWDSLGGAIAGSSLPLMSGTASAGADTANFARQDHVHPSDTSRAPINNPTFTGGVKETRSVVGASNIDLNSGGVFTRTISGATTFTVSNVPASGTYASFILDLTNGGAFAVTWWAGVKWVAGLAPVLTSSGRDSLGFFTHDGGTTWTGLVLAKDIR